MSRVDPRNTVGDVPFQWYTPEEHVGYDKQGRKILKKARMDSIDSFLARTDEPKSWRMLTDEVEDEYVEITKGEMKMLQGKSPDGKFNPHPVEGSHIETAVKEKKLKKEEKKLKEEENKHKVEGSHMETAVEEKKLKKKVNKHKVEGSHIETAVKEKKLKKEEKKLKEEENKHKVEGSHIETAVKEKKMKEEKKLKKKENKHKKKMLTNYEVIEGESENVKKNPKMNMLTNDNRLEVVKFLKEFYNITPPLKVLLDSACFQYMQMNDMSKESISHLFASVEIEFYTTSHTVKELADCRSLSVSTREASNCLIAGCVNGMLCSNDVECVLSLVKNDNQDGYIVATPDEALHAKLCQMNVPLLLCSGGVIDFNWPSQEQRDRQSTEEIEKSTSTNEIGSEGSREFRTRKKMSRVDPRNTVGDVPFQWYTPEEHVGYDKQGRKILKKARMDSIDSFLARTDEPKSWRMLTDEVEDEYVEITKGEMKMLQGKSPDGKFNPHPVEGCQIETSVKEKKEKKLNKKENKFKVC